MFQAQDKIGHYILLRKIGQGGFGEVWLAEKRSEFITRQVAIKLPTDDQVDKAAIRREAQLWEQASGHPNVLPIIDADVYDGQMAIVSEYADGGSLADKLKREGKLTVTDAVALTVGILHGLEYLHNKRIIHRDIKPANILLQGHTPRLADFGISRAMQTSVASSTAIIGTNAYMSPEAFDGARTPHTDIWSVGVVLYQLVTNTLPFPQENPSERMRAIMTQDFAPLPDAIPQNVRNVIAQALAKKPENRYQSAQEMRLALQNPLPDPKPSPFPTPVNARRKQLSRALVVLWLTLIFSWSIFAIYSLVYARSLEPKTKTDPPPECGFMLSGTAEEIECQKLKQKWKEYEPYKDAWETATVSCISAISLWIITFPGRWTITWIRYGKRKPD